MKSGRAKRPARLAWFGGTVSTPQRMLVRVTAGHVAAAIGDVKTFFELQAQRCANLGIDVADFPISHVAHRSRTWREYVATRDDLERVASAPRRSLAAARDRPLVVLFGEDADEAD